MAIYDAYAVRSRVKIGVAIKQHQAKRIFELGLRCSAVASKRILEIGPGDGYVAALSRAAGLAYTAIEGSAAVADKLSGIGLDVRQSYVPPLPVGLAPDYRCCYLLHVLEHMQSAAHAAQLVGEIRDRLLPGGALVIACPDYSRWGRYFYDCDYTHSYPLTRRRLAQLLRDQGFEIQCQTIYTGPIFGFLGLPLSWVAKLLYWPLLDDLIGPNRLRDVMNRGFLTFLPNLLMVARRPLS